MNSQTVTEATPVSPETISARWLVEVEDLLRLRFSEKLTVIRPGGLIGGERHPIKSLSGKTGVSGGNEKINLIHREDLIGIITNIPPKLGLVHAVAPFHPLKADYYREWANKLELPSPTFTESNFGAREIHSTVLNAFYKYWKCPRLDFI
jgi:hypothetical protein